LIALVTGAAAGFGATICRRLAKGGDRVIALGRRKDRLIDLQKELGADRLHANAVALSPEDVAEAVCWISALPEHVNINTLEMMPVSQSFGALPVSRRHANGV
jgi:NADP-dependent 3-hydroxy acid dehydrogenase YdfG